MKTKEQHAAYVKAWRNKRKDAQKKREDVLKKSLDEMYFRFHYLDELNRGSRIYAALRMKTGALPANC